MAYFPTGYTGSLFPSSGQHAFPGSPDLRSEKSANSRTAGSRSKSPVRENSPSIHERNERLKRGNALLSGSPVQQHASKKSRIEDVFKRNAGSPMSPPARKTAERPPSPFDLGPPAKDKNDEKALPDLSAFDCVAARPSAGPPPTPFKERTRRTLTPFVQNVLKIVDTGIIVHRGLYFQIRRAGPEGQFKSLYFVPGKIRLIQGRSNDTVYVKTYRSDLLHREDCRAIERYHRTAIKHHQELAAEGFPINRILNIQTALEDGFFIVLAVGIFKPEEHWGPSTALTELSPKAKVYLKEIRELFRLSFARSSKIPNDLQSNIGIDSEGKLVLNDFTESVENKEAYGFRLSARNQLEWFANGNPGIYQYLLSSVLHSNAPDALTTYKNLNRDSSNRIIDFKEDLTPFIVPPAA